ncbi:MAG: hypothetical protein AAFQ07_19980, partial [Chloroflexota bacterium]
DNYQQALAIRREMQDQRGIADSLGDLALCMMTQDVYAGAIEAFSEALEIRRNIGDRIGEGGALTGRGISYLLDGQLDNARRDLGRAQLIGEETGFVFVRAQAYAGLGEVAFTEGRYDEAMRYFKMVLGENNGEEAPLPTVLWGLLGIAQVKTARGDELKALSIVTLILRYPRNYINIIERRTTDLLDQLTASVAPENVQSTMTASKSLVLENVVAELLAE